MDWLSLNSAANTRLRIHMAVIVMQRPDLHRTLPAIILIFAIQSCVNVDPGATGEPAQPFVSFVSSSSSLQSPNPQGGISRGSDVEAGTVR
jgi:hypothetical protein